jgi:O-antigen ligase
MPSRAQIHQKIFYYLLVLQGFAFPLWKKITPVILILIILNLLIEFNFASKIKKILAGKNLFFLLLFISVYLLYLIGLLYTTNFDYAGFDLEVKLTFLVIPLFLFLSGLEELSKEKVKNILIAFVLGCFASSLFSIIHSIYFYNLTGDIFWMYYVYVSYFVHPSYMSMYTIFAIAITGFFLINGLIENKKFRYFLFFLMFWFVLYVILLTAKAGIICMLLISAILFVYWIIKKRQIVMSLITAVFFIAIVGISISQLSFLTKRLTSTISAMNNTDINVNKDDGTVQRIEIWKTSVEIIKDNFLIGVGTGDVKDELLKRYDEKGMNFAKKNHLNAHSQYFQTFITLGLFGFLALIALFIFPSIDAFKNRNYIYLFFLLIVAVNISVESMFENQAGVVFYTFFNTFLFLTGKQNADLKEID